MGFWGDAQAEVDRDGKHQAHEEHLPRGVVVGAQPVGDVAAEMFKLLDNRCLGGLPGWWVDDLIVASGGDDRARG